jgi:hypothetical protein
LFFSVPEELPGGGLPTLPGLGNLQHNRFCWRKKHPVVFFPVLSEKKAACRLLPVGEQSSLSSSFRSRSRKNHPVLFFPVQLEKKSKQKAASRLLKTAIHGDVKRWFAVKTDDLFLMLMRLLSGKHILCSFRFSLFL